MSIDKYLNENIQPISDVAQQALDIGAQDTSLFITFEEASKLMDAGYHHVETGYCMGNDGSAFVNVLTDMPGVTPAMWDWWFGWHGEDISHYRLWHPKDHLEVQWEDNLLGQNSYITYFLNTEEIARLLYIKLRYLLINHQLERGQ